MSSGRSTSAAYAFGSLAAGSSKTPIRNIERRIRVTMSSSRAIGTWPEVTASFSGWPKYVLWKPRASPNRR